MLVKEEGKTISRKEEQPQNALAPILFKEKGRTISHKEEQPQKTNPPILIKEEGRTILHKEEQPENAHSRHYKIFCVNGNTGFRNESRIYYFIHLQNEKDYERKNSSSA